MELRHQFDYDTYTVLLLIQTKILHYLTKAYDMDDEEILRKVLEESLKEQSIAK